MTRYIDLSLGINEENTRRFIECLPNNMKNWQTIFNVEITPIMTVKKDGRSIKRINMSTHCCTHIDVPAHFIENGRTLDQIPLDDLICEAIVVDVRNISQRRAILVTDLLEFDAGIRSAKAILIRTGWFQENFGTKEYFIAHPYLTPEAADYLIECGIKLIGIDFPCIDQLENIKIGQKLPMHVKILGNDLLMIEHIINMEKIRKERFTLIALPLNISGLDGFPTRVIAVET